MDMIQRIDLEPCLSTTRLNMVDQRSMPLPTAKPSCILMTGAILQGEAFSRAIRGEAPLEYGLEDAILNMRVLEALFRSGHSEPWEAR